MSKQKFYLLQAQACEAGAKAAEWECESLQFRAASAAFDPCELIDREFEIRMAESAQARVLNYRETAERYRKMARECAA